MPKSATLFYLAERMPVGTQTVVAVIVVDIDIIIFDAGRTYLLACLTSI